VGNLNSKGVHKQATACGVPIQWCFLPEGARHGEVRTVPIDLAVRWALPPAAPARRPARGARLPRQRPAGAGASAAGAMPPRRRAGCARAAGVALEAEGERRTLRAPRHHTDGREGARRRQRRAKKRWAVRIGSFACRCAPWAVQ